jgi:SpoIID/LytB domain protein
MRTILVALCVVAFVGIALTIPFVIKADELDDITKQLGDLNKSLQSSQAATHNNEQTLKNLTSQLNSIKNQVYAVEKEIAKKEKEVKEGEEALDAQKKVLQERTISYYKNMNKNSGSLATILLSGNISASLNDFFYQKTLLDQDRKTILQVLAYIKDLQTKKDSLEKESTKLEAIKSDVDKQSQFMANEVAKSKAFENQLQQQIATLNAKQQALIAAKQASLNIPKSAGTSQGGCSDDRDIDPGFSPRFAFYTFGTPHRVGLNQYGAKGRAEAGQNAEQILKSYYNADYTTGYNQSVTIHVVGTNEYGQSFDDNWSIEEYLKHLYEMPTTWPSEALKAQAIAARSYVLATTNNGANSICPSQSCQVVKREENSDAWKDAVNATAGIVMTNGGQPIKAWFASTHGGYEHSSGDVGWNDTSWTKNMRDTTGDVNSFDDLKNNAYDKASPWFYCDWGARSQYAKTAWLKPEEVADFVNVLSLAKRDSSIIDHLYQVDKPNPAGTDTWDFERVKSELRSRGGNPFNTISSVSVDWDKGSGKVTTIHLTGDAGDVSFDGGEFKGYFNVRAPANLQIVGPLFNAEKK